MSIHSGKDDQIHIENKILPLEFENLLTSMK